MSPNLDLLDNDTQIGTCDHCGESEVAVYTDNELCEECDGYCIHCLICDERQHTDDLCRHVFRDCDYDWQGSGSGNSGSSSVKESFFALLSAMPSGFAADLALVLPSGKFYTWFSAPLIGSGGIFTLNGTIKSRVYGEALAEIGQDEKLGKRTGDGYKWLVSLYEDQTPDANKVTVEWTKDYLAAVA